MQREAELEWIRRFLEHLRAGTTELAPEELRLPSSIYTSEDHLAKERRGLFHGHPIVAGLSADLPEPGSFFSLRVADVPVIVMRHRDGQARAFVNACRHRGGPIVEGRGCAQGGRLRCPFHAWTYTMAGELVAIPHAEFGFDGVDRSQMGLHPLACAEAEGLILVRVDGSEPIDAKAALRGLADDLQSLDLASYHHFDTRLTHWQCNWKLLLATFLESYHVFSLHKESVHPWYFSHPMVHDGWGPNIRFPVARRTIAELLEKPESGWRLADHATVQWLISPNALLSYTRDYLLLWRFFSPQPNRCDIITSLYSATAIGSAEATQRLGKAFDGQMRISGTEDFPLQEKIQRGLDSGALPEIIFGRNEVAAIAFQRGLEELLQAAGEN